MNMYYVYIQYLMVSTIQYNHKCDILGFEIAMNLHGDGLQQIRYWYNTGSC